MIRYLDEERMFLISTDNIAYVIKIEDSKLKNIYFGEKLVFDFDYIPEIKKNIFINWSWNYELSDRSENNYANTAFKVLYHDGVRDCELLYKNYEIFDNKLKIELFDEFYGMKIFLFYEVFEHDNIIKKYYEVNNISDQKINIEILKNSLYIPILEGNFNYLKGMWGHETNIVHEKINQGIKSIGSRTGNTGHLFNPYFSIDDGADEDNGNVWFGLLGWSGNWSIDVHKQDYEYINISAGYNEWDFNYILLPNESIKSPELIFGFTNEGFGESSRILHSFIRKHILRKIDRKILYNSWEATGFDVNESNQMKLAELASKIGIELFVVDDGWFGKRNDDKAGLGDWYINKEKFSRGLSPLIKKVKELGMDFGIWVEPEMVNPDSQLYRNHPDWILGYESRKKTEIRNQLVLNIIKKEVKDYIIDFMTDLLSNNDISFIKWDFNRPILESGFMNKINSKSIWIDYVESFYYILDILKRRFPYVIFESCAGGGGRIDIEILKYADQVWTSDNTNPYDRLIIQKGFSYAYPSNIMMAWVTDWAGKETYPLKYRFHSAMLGSLGIGSNLNNYSEEELNIFSNLIKDYKDIRNIVYEGDLYRINMTDYKNLEIFEYLKENKEEGVAFIFQNPTEFDIFNVYKIKLKGLNESYVYEIENKLYSGKSLMKFGFYMQFDSDIDYLNMKKNNYMSKIIRFKLKKNI